MLNLYLSSGMRGGVPGLQCARVLLPACQFLTSTLLLFPQFPWHSSSRGITQYCLLFPSPKWVSSLFCISKLWIRVFQSQWLRNTFLESGKSVLCLLRILMRETRLLGLGVLSPWQDTWSSSLSVSSLNHILRDGDFTVFIAFDQASGGVIWSGFSRTAPQMWRT